MGEGAYFKAPLVVKITVRAFCLGGAEEAHEKLGGTSG